MIPNHGPNLEFGLGEAADMIRETTARFAADKIAPLAAEIDRTNNFPRELWPQMGELGLLGLAFFSFGVVWGLTAKPDYVADSLATPFVVAALAGLAGVGFFMVAIFRLLQRLGRAAEHD